MEAALSIGVRGDPAAARQALEPLVSGAGNGSSDWAAAAALAQLGDPSGWPTLQRDLGEGIEHVRLMAARQLIVFVPYEGQEVGGVEDRRGGGAAPAGRRPLRVDPRRAPRLLEEAGFAP